MASDQYNDIQNMASAVSNCRTFKNTTEDFRATGASSSSDCEESYH